MEDTFTRVNSFEDRSHDEWLEAGRMWWKASAARIIQCERLYVLDAANIVRAVGRIEGVLRDVRGGTGRTGILAIPEPDNEWIGTKIERPSSRNPVVYMTEIVETF